MKRAGWSFTGVVVGLALLAVAQPASAKRTGMNVACNNCHEGRDPPQIAVTLSSARIEPGQALTITVTAKHPTATVGGVLVDSYGVGAFELIDTVGTRLFDDTVTQATHSMPQRFANGQVQFSFRWVAPATPGANVIDVWSNAGNDNGKPDDDSPAEALAGVAVGCDGAWYYSDFDKDGAGAETGKAFSCTPMPDRILQGGDCDDDNAKVNPAAVELCNDIDDDCDGKIDEGFTPILLVSDADGDGFGARNGKTIVGCPPIANFAPTFDDCNDTDPSIHPGATEIANGRDDNCNGQVDDLGAVPGSGGSAGTAGTAGSAGTLTPASPAAAASSCALSLPSPLSPLPLFGGGLLFGWALVRRFRRVRRVS